jgi:phage gp16-like protein
MTIDIARRQRIAKIHVAKKDLALVDDTYRAILLRVTGKSSSADCTDAQLDLVLGEFKRLGFEGKKAYAGPKSEHAYHRMVYSLWSGLKPYLTDHSRAALRAFIERQTGLGAVEFLGPEDANNVIEGLKAWLERERNRKAQAVKKTAFVTPKMRRAARRKTPE